MVYGVDVVAWVGETVLVGVNCWWWLGWNTLFRVAWEWQLYYRIWVGNYRAITKKWVALKLLNYKNRSEILINIRGKVEIYPCHFFHVHIYNICRNICERKFPNVFLRLFLSRSRCLLEDVSAIMRLELDQFRMACLESKNRLLDHELSWLLNHLLLAAQNLMANRLINYLETKVGETERAYLTFQEEKGHCCFA